MTRDQPIFGFYRYIGIGQNRPMADLIILSRCWPKCCYISDNLCKKAQWSKPRQLSYSKASRCGFRDNLSRL